MLKRRIQFSLSAVLLFVTLVASTATVAFVYLKLGPITAQQAAALDAMGEEARTSIAGWSLNEPRPGQVDRFLVEACRQSKTFQYAERYLGPSADSSSDTIVRSWCVQGGTNSTVSATCYSIDNGIEKVTGYGSDKETFAYSREYDEYRRRALFWTIVVAALPASLLIVAGIERLRTNQHSDPSRSI